MVIPFRAITGMAGRGSLIDFNEASPNYGQKFEISFRVGNGWKTILTDPTIGHTYEKSCAPVTAQKF